MSSPDSASQESHRWDWSAVDAGLIAILIGISLFNFVRRGPTAWEWPAIDMAVLYERHVDADFLTGDYFTNSVAASNPRHIFGLGIIALTRLLGADWFTVYFWLRTLLTTITPALWFLVVVSVVTPTLRTDRQRWIARLFAVAALGLVMNRKFATFFTIAWWPPLQIYAGAHPTSLALSLFAIVLEIRLPGRAKWISLLPWTAATLIHPAIGLLMLVFSAATTLTIPGWPLRHLRGLLAVAPSAVLISRLYQPDAPLSTQEFIDVYVRTCHPFHYDVFSFATSTKFPWWVSFLIVSGLLTACGLIGRSQQRVEIARTAGVFLATYIGCIAIQWIAIDVLPSKVLAQIGPSRFSFAGYFFLTISGSMTAATVWPTTWDVPKRLQQFEARIHRWFQPATVAIAATAATSFVAIGLSPQWRQAVRAPHAAFYDWVERNTAADSVFHLPPMHPLHQNLPLIAQRATFASAGFPFREDDFPEHQLRMTAGYKVSASPERHLGTFDQRQRNEKFHRLTPVDIQALTEIRKLDYIVFETSRLSDFYGISPSYSDDNVVVLDVRKLRESKAAETQKLRSQSPVTRE